MIENRKHTKQAKTERLITMVKNTLAEKSGKQNIKKCKKIIALAKELNAMGYGNVKFTADNIGDIENNDKEGGQSERR